VFVANKLGNLNNRGLPCINIMYLKILESEMIFSSVSSMHELLILGINCNMPWYVRTRANISHYNRIMTVESASDNEDYLTSYSPLVTICTSFCTPKYSSISVFCMSFATKSDNFPKSINWLFFIKVTFEAFLTVNFVQKLNFCTQLTCKSRFKNL